MDVSFLTFLQKSPLNMILAGVALASGGMLIWPFANRVFAGSTAQVEPTAAVQLINRRDALVLDVRDKADYNEGHIPNARNVPLAELESRAREIDRYKTRPVLVCCQPSMRAGTVSGVLKKLGFTEVFTLRGGLPGWKEASLPVAKSA